MSRTVIPQAISALVGRQWLNPLLDWLDTTLASIIGGQPTLEVDAVVVAALAIGAGPFVYANGTAGVGATLTADANGAFPTVDGMASALNKVYLVTAEAGAAGNGIYKLSTLGDGSTKAVLTRLAAFDQAAEVKTGALIGVRSGTVNANTTWKYTGVDSPTMGTTSLTFVRDPLTVTTNTAQTITGAKTWGGVQTFKAASAPAVNNSGDTFATTIASAASANRTATLADQTGTIPVCAQGSPTGATTVTSAGSGTALKADTTTTGGSGSTAYTFADVVVLLKTAGILKT